ncbi:MAG: YkgJ family cysteine cluster protein [Thermosphaera sp.]
MSREVKQGEKVLFQCQRSGVCCNSGPNVILTSYDICRIAKYLNVEWRQLVGKYINALVADHIPIPFLRGDRNKCAFLVKTNRLPSCSIYPARPMRCRLFPFIPYGPNILDKVYLSSICPGVGKGEPVNPPWYDLRKYSEEVSKHYNMLFNLIFEKGYEPIGALEEVVDTVCKESQL